jgi:hypothetical protein
MKAVYKYDLSIDDYVTIKLPRGAKVLTAQVQHGDIKLWAFVNTEEELEDRLFRIVGTGHPLQNARFLNYIATVQLMAGPLVFHVFEVKNENA